MELEQLRIYVSAARCASFSEAARRLYISHSTVSRAVSALEEELGVCLLERGNRVLGLTAAGEALLREAEALLAAADETAACVREAGEKMKKKEEA